MLLAPGFLPHLAAQKVEIDYDKSTDFSKFKTYAWVPGTPVFDPQMDAYITNNVGNVLRGRGLTETSISAADLLVTYHAAINTDLSIGKAIDPTYAATGGVPAPGYSIWQSAGGGALHVTKGSLTFEILDRAANQPIWIGTAKQTVSDKPFERWTQVQKALAKLFHVFPPTPEKSR